MTPLVPIETVATAEGGITWDALSPTTPRNNMIEVQSPLAPLLAPAIDTDRMARDEALFDERPNLVVHFLLVADLLDPGSLDEGVRLAFLTGAETVD